MSQIMRTCSSMGRPSFAISDGLVVTPSTIPQLAPFFSSSRFAVSRKNFKIVPPNPLYFITGHGGSDPPRPSRPLASTTMKTVSGKTFYLETFGCQMNAHDSEKVAGTLLAQGYSQVATPEAAGLVLFNTCSIRDKAE